MWLSMSLSFSGKATDAAAAERGTKIFADNCAVCHGDGGKGNPELGAPNLTDGIWLYGGKLADIEKTVRDWPRRCDAVLERPPRPCDDQDARRLRPFSGRRQVAYAQASRRESSNDHDQPGRGHRA